MRSPCTANQTIKLRLVGVAGALPFLAGILAGLVGLTGCDNYFKNDYKDNSPTSGRLKVFYDEGLQRHAKNQAFTFTAQYPRASLDLTACSEDEAIKALFNDSCEAIFLSRLLTASEQKAFESRQYFPKYSAVALSGVALITNVNTAIRALNKQQIAQLLGGDNVLTDSLGQPLKLNALLDRNNSSVVHYLSDSLLEGKKFSANCGVLKSTLEAIEYVANTKNTIAFIDFAWLSDKEDSLVKVYTNKVKFVGVQTQNGAVEFPSQSSFKLGTYPFARKIYVMRKTGDFSLAKGFESFVAGPKGQLTFLKQGLLPNRQAERVIEVKMEPMSTQ